MGRQGKEYTFTAFCCLVAIVVTLVALSFIPPFTIGGVEIRRANILSDLITFPSDTLAERSVAEGIVAEADSLLGLLAQVDTLPAVIEPQRTTRVMPPWEMSASVGTAINSVTDLDKPLFDASTMVDDIGEESGVDVAIEQFGEGGSAMADFRRVFSRQRRERPLRIAVLGDSFIENDILTADLRENFQELLGGNGVGFVPFSSPIAQYRKTIRHTFEGWEYYSLMNYKSVPERLRGRFFVSGGISIPEEGATVRMEGTEFRRYLSEATVVRLLFVNEGATEIRVRINDSLSRSFTPPPSTELQQIIIRGNISILDMSFHNVEGFIGYGVVFEDRSGVCVDNFSVRGNSGQALFNTSVGINRQMNRLLRYDLVILQYGLNMMQADVVDYSTFGRMLERLIKYVRGCFEGSSVLVMGVGDRGFRIEDSVRTTPAVEAMIVEQREASKRASAAFWNTFEAMGGENSMSRFFERKWAAADGVHIGYAGGRYIARSLFRSLMELHNRGEDSLQYRSPMEPSVESIISDTVRLDTLEVELLPADTTFGEGVAPADSVMLSDSVQVEQIDTLPKTELLPIADSVEVVPIDTLIKMEGEL